MNRLTQEKILEVNDIESLPTYESCLLEKMTKWLFIEKDKQASEVLNLVHTDVCEPMNISIRGRYYYFFIFTNDLSRYGYIYLMTHKSESFEIFKYFHNEVEKQIEKSIKTIWFDRGGKYLSNKFLTYLEKNKILSQWFPPETPQYNGVLERRKWTLLDMIRSMIEFANLPIFFWGYALETVCYILNKV